jgi:hypothetical protein
MAYAENTAVPTDRSKAEIEKTLARYGADQFMHGWDREMAVVGFRADGKYVRFVLPIPDRADFATTDRGKKRAAAAAEKAYEQAVRQRWRALALVIKAKLEAVESGIVTFQEEFLAHFVLPDGTTVAEAAVPALEEAYLTGKMPRMLPAVT